MTKINMPSMMIKTLLFQSLIIMVVLLCSFGCESLALPTADDGAAALHKQYAALTPHFHNNQFKRPIYLDSAEFPSTLKGDIYAIMAYPFQLVNSALNDPEQGPANWCDLLMLHPNIKYCRASGSSNCKKLFVCIGKKAEQPLSDAYLVEFDYRVAASSPLYFRVNLKADNGPLYTKNYHITLEAVPIDTNHTFLHLTYSYSYGMSGCLALKAYLATTGRNKIGFTSTGIGPDGKPSYVKGLRGIVERNTMRYYLAIDAYLSALSLPTDKRMDKRLSSWFTASEQYAPQLHEMDWSEYVQMKHKEYQRQQGTAKACVP